MRLLYMGPPVVTNFQKFFAISSMGKGNTPLSKSYSFTNNMLFRLSYVVYLIEKILEGNIDAEIFVMYDVACKKYLKVFTL